MIDPVKLAQDLIRCPSVTPKDAGALGVVESALGPLGFQCYRLTFGEVANLYARIGSEAPNFCFAGHTDVVPPGERKLWQNDPFAAEVKNGVLFGRGAADMKSAIAAFIAAAERQIAKGMKGSISLLITGDEEGIALNGTKKVLEWMTQKGERIDHCLVGEPTSVARTGDTIKIGRRGSMRIEFTAKGAQGHTAYPQNALNPIPVLARLVAELAATPLDSGTQHFEPSTLVFTTFDVGNKAANVSPAEAFAACNIRFNDLHTPDSLLQLARDKAAAIGGDAACEIAIDASVSGVAFLTEPGRFTAMLSKAVQRATNEAPKYSTGGGTSDARFIKNVCPVVELGLAGATMHKANECVPVAEIAALTDIYA
ncbi:MAG TPA: succinyl-diaminopimelate desuccinylase, partial [Rhizomicrobium sp.]|nr:succinyl-diaminopimelate desuccinylase [Rhizomicrobium sp.]